MSFDAIVNSDVRSSQPKEIEIGGYTFYANEIKSYERLHLGTLNALDQEGYSQLVLYSITDQDGKKMTREQLDALNDDVFMKFFNAALEINQVDEVDSEKN